MKLLQKIVLFQEIYYTNVKIVHVNGLPNSNFTFKIFICGKTIGVIIYRVLPSIIIFDFAGHDSKCSFYFFICGKTISVFIYLVFSMITIYNFAGQDLKCVWRYYLSYILSYLFRQSYFLQVIPDIYILREHKKYYW